MEFPISNDGIRAALDALLAEADTLGVTRATAHRLAVIVDEYCSNLIRHDDSVGPESMFDLALSAESDRVTVTIEESAGMFDPTTYHQSVPRDIGGQGIVLMRGLATALDYRSIDGSNRFRATILETDKT